MYIFDHYLPYLGTLVVPATAGNKLPSTLSGETPLSGENLLRSLCPLIQLVQAGKVGGCADRRPVE
jgi:hypothetical protein